MRGQSGSVHSIAYALIVLFLGSCLSAPNKPVSEGEACVNHYFRISQEIREVRKDNDVFQASMCLGFGAGLFASPPLAGLTAVFSATGQWIASRKVAHIERKWTEDFCRPK